MLSNETKINEIRFNSKYISGHALKVLTDFTNNSYIIKGSTGIGGTTALLNYTKGHCLIISPNVGMIKSKAKGKEQKIYSSDDQFFLYDKSHDNWNDVNDYLSYGNNAIINTTPDQIIKIKKHTNKELYKQLTQIPIFIDENHSFIIDSDYRQVVGEFLELVFNEWSANFKLSTATPNYKFLDVPKDKNVKYYKLIRANQPTKKIQISNSKKDVKQFIQSEHLKGRLVVVFTNNIDYHKSLTNLRVKNLVGQTLDTKLKPFERGLSLDNDLYDNTDVIFLSSSYIAGYDIPKDCSICIVSEQSNEAYKTNINNVVQAYGRCRATVHDALFVNVESKTTATKINGQNVILTNQPITITDIENKINGYEKSINYYQTKINDSEWYVQHTDNEITSQNYVNRAVILKPILSTIYDYQLYNESVLNETLEGYGFEVSKYVNEDDNIIIPKGVKLKFEDRINNLLKLDETELRQSYYNIKRNLKFKDKGNFSVKLAFEYLTSFLIKKTDAKQIIEILNNKRIYANEFYNSMDLFLYSNVDTKYYNHHHTPNQLKKVKDVIDNDTVEDIKILTDDWQMLYACHKVTNNVLPGNIEREIQLYELFYDVDLCIKYNVNKNRIRNTAKAILKRCVDLSITLNDNECVWLKDVVKSIFKALDNNEQYTHNNSRKNIKSKMTNALLFLLTNGTIKQFNDVKNREYNPLTQLPTNMRSIIPIKYVSVDLSSANPQICDSILGTSIGLNVYQYLMTNRAISRPQAKKLFNSTLNKYYLTVSKAKKVYIDSGYDNDKALELARLTANGTKGAFFELMTANEKILMQNYSNILTIKNYRFHDALIMKYEDIDLHHLVLPTMVKGYKYHVEIFNDGSDYNGRLTDLENNGHVIDNEYYI